MGLRDIEATLPPGFRFYPSDEELVCHYLYKKIANEEAINGTLVEIDLHTCEPWQLPDVAKLNADQWYFFSFRDRKYATGFRTNRATTTGYWKATGKDRPVVNPVTGGIVGMRKTLVFYRNRAPNGIKTGWIMHEFRLETPHMPPKEDWVLCRVFHKSRGENSGGLSPEYVAESLNISSSPPVDQPIPSDYNSIPAALMSSAEPFQSQSQSQSQSNGSSLLNLLQYSQERENNHMNEFAMKNEDEGRFFWDTSLEEHCLGNGAASHPDDMRYPIDNRMIYL